MTAFAPGDRARVTYPGHPLHGRAVVVRSARPVPGMADLVRVTPEDGGQWPQWPVFADELEALTPPTRARPTAVGDRAAPAPRGGS